MRVLVTRPEDDARETAARLEALGHTAIVAPLIAVHFLSGPELDLTGVQAFLSTSSNGVRALARRSSVRRLPLFAVGRQTAHSARALGFTTVNDADGDVAALADHVSARLDPRAGALVHATAREAPGTLADALEARGFRVQSEFLYETPIVAELPQVAKDALRNEVVDTVLLFSARTALAFRQLVERARVEGRCSKLTACCISRSCADALFPLAFSALRIAEAPNQD